MNINLQPKQFLFIYNCLKRQEREYCSAEEDDLLESVKSLLEDVILDSFKTVEAQAFSTGFDKWLKSETNKIQGLEDELKKIKENVPQEALLSGFTKATKNVVRSTRKKKK